MHLRLPPLPGLRFLLHCKRIISIIAVLMGLSGLLTVPSIAWDSNAQALGSLESYTGILYMPNARVKPDWSMRLKIGHNDPYTYYGGALGIFDRFEFHGQFTQVNTIEGFPGYGYGDDRDRSAGMRMVLIKENEMIPQISAGFYDAIGTGLYPSRYITASKMIGNLDLTLGLGQGILAGDYPKDQLSGSDIGQSFLFSDPLRKTKPFGGAEWHFSPDLSFIVEYSTINWSNMYGYRDGNGNKLKDDNSLFDFNIGVKYKFTDYLHTTAALIGGNNYALGLNFEIPLDPEGFLAWKKPKAYNPTEKLKWRAAEATNTELSILVSEEIKKIGFSNVASACSIDSVWIEFNNSLHLSDARAIGRVGTALDKILPPRIQTFYINLRKNGTIISSLRFGRSELNAFFDSKIDNQGLLAFSDFTLYKTKHWRSFEAKQDASGLQIADEPRLSFSIQPKLRTFLNNRSGFFKHKGLLRAQASYKLWQGATMLGELEYTVYNEYDELIYDPLERENSVRTDLVQYETGQEIRLSQFAYNQFLDLPGEIEGRFSAGYFETQYAGIGFECFRYFNDGLWGIGLESQFVKKRDPYSTFKIHEKYDDWYKTAFLNIYANIFPSLGLEGGVKIGRFLAGDKGVRVDLRRTFKYFTIGAWYTKTDTDLFASEKNREAEQKGVYITFPLSMFADRDIPKRLKYTFSSFTRDQGATVRQPGSLYPVDPFSTPSHINKTMNDMRQN